MTQLLLFQNRHPEGQFECPCGAISESGEYQSLGYKGWCYPTVIKHFQFEGQRVIAFCPACNMPGAWLQRELLWRFKPANGESCYRFLDRVYKKAQAAS